MRILALAILAIGAVSAAAPAQAQTYDPSYPVCLHVYGRISYYECTYTSLPQCNASASGRSAQCVINPYFANAYQEPRPPIRSAAACLLSAARTERRSYSSSTTWPSTSDTRRSIRPASSMLWVAISIATRVAFTSCISALKT